MQPRWEKCTADNDAPDWCACCGDESTSTVPAIPTTQGGRTLDITMIPGDVVHGYQHINIFWNGHHGERCFMLIHGLRHGNRQAGRMLLRTGKNAHRCARFGWHIRRPGAHILARTGRANSITSALGVAIRPLEVRTLEGHANGGDASKRRLPLGLGDQIRQTLEQLDESRIVNIYTDDLRGQTRRRAAAVVLRKPMPGNLVSGANEAGSNSGSEPVYWNKFTRPQASDIRSLSSLARRLPTGYEDRMTHSTNALIAQPRAPAFLTDL